MRTAASTGQAVEGHRALSGARTELFAPTPGPYRGVEEKVVARVIRRADDGCASTLG
jgi:hypothetical protein